MSINCLLESGTAAVSAIKAAATITLRLPSYQADSVPCSLAEWRRMVNRIPINPPLAMASELPFPIESPAFCGAPLAFV